MSWPDEGRVAARLDSPAKDLGEAQDGRVPLHDDLVDDEQPVRGPPRIPDETVVDDLGGRLRKLKLFFCISIYM